MMLLVTWYNILRKSCGGWCWTNIIRHHILSTIWVYGFHLLIFAFYWPFAVAFVADILFLWDRCKYFLLWFLLTVLGWVGFVVGWNILNGICCLVVSSTARTTHLTQLCAFLCCHQLHSVPFYSHFTSVYFLQYSRLFPDSFWSCR